VGVHHPPRDRARKRLDGHAGVVARRPDGRRRIYRLDAAPLQKVHDWTAEYERFWEERLVRLRRGLDQ